MPTYEYKCDACGHAFEQFHSMTADPIRKCPACKKLKVKRMIGTGAGLIFKGSGFYITDYRDQGYKDKAKAEAGGDGAKTDGAQAAPAGDGGGTDKAASADGKKSDAPAAAKGDGKSPPATPAPAKAPTASKPAEPSSASKSASKKGR